MRRPPPLYYGKKGWLSAPDGVGAAVKTLDCPSKTAGDKDPFDTWYFTTHDWTMEKHCRHFIWVIYNSDYNNKDVIKKGAKVSLRRWGTKKSWLSAHKDGGKQRAKVVTADCPGGNNGYNTRTCRCENFKVHDAGYHFKH